ncbi:MAG: hypothetical protein U0835_04130 [Isosphaeraceae bacterium]
MPGQNRTRAKRSRPFSRVISAPWKPVSVPASRWKTIAFGYDSGSQRRNDSENG